MNTTTIAPTTLLFAGEEIEITMLDGTKVRARVRSLPARHLLTLLDLFDVGREAELIERCLQIVGDTDELWKSVEKDFVDSLSDESHVALVELVKKLNFSRAVSNAERQIAMGQGLLPMKERISQVMIAPIKKEMESLVSSVTTQLRAAAAAKKP